MNVNLEHGRSPGWRISTVALCLLLAIIAASCTAPPPLAATATPGNTPQPPPTTVATRIVTQEIVVTATPALPPACALARLEEANEMVIGVLAPLSQRAAWPRAMDMQAGVSLAIEDVNGAGGVDGKPLRVIVQDTAGDAQLAARLAESLVTRDCASAIIGGFTTEEATAIKDVSIRHNVPFIIVDATADELTSDRSPSLFRVAPAASMIAQMPSKWLATVGDYNEDGSQHVLLIVENTAGGQAALERADRSFPQAGINYDVLRVDAPLEDYSALIARVVASDQVPDVIMLYVMGDTVLDLLHQLLTAGVGPQKGTLLVAGSAALNGAQFWTRVPEGAYTVVGQRGPWYTSVTPMGEAFVERYHAFAPQWPGPVAFASYDAIHLLADAAERAGSTEPQGIISTLETTDVTLASGYYHFPFNSQRPPSGPLEPEYLWHQWPDPALLYMQYREPQQDPATIDVLWPPIYRTTDTPVLRP